MREINICLNNKKKTFVLPSTFCTLKEIVSESFKISKDFHFTFIDDQQDCVVISNEFDYTQTLIFLENQNIKLLKCDICFNRENESNSDLSKNNSFDFNPTPILKNYIQTNVKEKNESYEKTQLKNSSQKNISNKNMISKRKDQSSVKFILERVLNLYRKLYLVNRIRKLKSNCDKCQQFLNSNYLKEDDQILSFNNIMMKESKPKLNNLDDFIQNKNLIAENPLNSISQKFKTNNSSKCLKQNVKKLKKTDKRENEKIKNVETRDLFILQNKEIKEHFNDLLEKKFSELLEKINLSNIKKNSLLPNSIESFKIINLQNEVNNNIHNSTKCKGCNMTPIKGIRYKCSICKDFDYCESCEEKNVNNHNHNFIKIRLEEKSDSDNKYKKSFSLQSNNNQIYNSKFIAVSEPLIIFEGEDIIIHAISIENNGFNDWPTPCYLINTQGLKGMKIIINDKLESGSVYLNKVTLITQNLPCGDYSSKWQLFDENNVSFGQTLEIKVKVLKKKVYIHANKLNKLKKNYDLVGISDESILQALEKANGNLDEAILYLF